MILVESSFYPFVPFSFRGKDHAEAEYRSMLKTTAAVAESAIREQTKYVSITVGGTEQSATERKMVARLMAEYPAELLGPIIGSYVIAESALVRGIITALRWISPKVGMIEPVASLDEALKAAETTFQRHGIAVDASRVAGARRFLRAEIERQRRAASPSARAPSQARQRRGG